MEKSVVPHENEILNYDEQVTDKASILENYTYETNTAETVETRTNEFESTLGNMTKNPW